MKSKNDKPKWNFAYAMICAAIFVAVFFVYLVFKRNVYQLPALIVWMEVGLGIVLLFLMLISMVKKKISLLWWEAMMLVLVLAGVWIFAIAVFPLWIGISTAAILILLAFFWPLTIFNNLMAIAGVLGISMVIAWQFPYIVTLFCVLGVLLYDYYRSNEAGLASLYYDAWKANIIPGFLLPGEFGGWLVRVEKVWKPGVGHISSFLPFIAMAVMALHIMVWGGFWWYAVYAGLILTVGVKFSSISAKKLFEPWLFLAPGLAVYLVFGMINYL
ncbi:MAG: hypothetical protein ACOYUZ_00875 [Patescibacteria group bacterium]